MLLTNDTRTPQVVVMVEGRVAPELTVSPSPLMLGLLQPEQTVTKQLLIRAPRPFKVTALKAEGGEFSFKFDPQASKQVHVVPVTFKADASTGKVTAAHPCRDRPGRHGVADIEAFGEVAAPFAGN